MDSSKLPNVHVVIIGAGLSGLRAARDIHAAGFTYVVLEAMDRVGGKTLSVQTSPDGKGQGMVDMGASWLNDTNQSEIYALAKEFGFDLVKQRTEGTSVSRDVHGKPNAVQYPEFLRTTAEEAKELETMTEKIEELVDNVDLDEPHQTVQARELDSLTVQEFASKAFETDLAGPFLDFLCQSLLGADSHQVSAFFLLDYMKRGTGFANITGEFKDGAEHLRNRQGNQSFSVKLAAGLRPNSVKVSTAVTSITQSDQHCVVETSTGNTYMSSRVIVSAPTYLLEKINFSPDLPAEKKRLNGSTKIGHFTKVVLVFDEPWWHHQKLSGAYNSMATPPVSMTFGRDTCAIEDGQYSITLFQTGEAGRRWGRLSPVERRNATLRDFREAFNVVSDKIPEPINVIEYDWTGEPWARGCPCAFTPPGILASEAGQSLGKPFGKVHFVGTESADVWKGYMDGAVRSGVRGAKEVITALKKK